jgi:3-deoxy-D-manno-octulosonic-acid transferase
LKYTLIKILWILIYTPIWFSLRFILMFVPKAQDRFKFEELNRMDANEAGSGGRSFGKDKIKADLCIEFSSEGEYQQVASLIADALSEGKKLELVFFSPSVEKTIIDLQHKHPEQIRYFRYALLDGYTFSSWATADTLILVRYDLFPEFLIWAMKPGRKLKFVWATFKKERMQAKVVSPLKKAFLKKSSYTVYSTNADLEQARDMGLSGVVYDFRMEQIYRRIENRMDKYSKLFALYPEFKNHLESYPRGKRLILGNAWAEDMFLLENISSDVLIVIVPHKLQPEIIAKMTESLLKFNRTPTIISDDSTTIAMSSTLILNKKGILCELYADFGKAYVGGGFGVSVHSLLEPLIAGSEHLACGPVNHRSTEFDLGLEYGLLKEVKNSQEFKDWLNLDIPKIKDRDRLLFQIAKYSSFKKDLLSC